MFEDNILVVIIFEAVTFVNIEFSDVKFVILVLDELIDDAYNDDKLPDVAVILCDVKDDDFIVPATSKVDVGLVVAIPILAVVGFKKKSLFEFDCKTLVPV